MKYIKVSKYLNKYKMEWFISLPLSLRLEVTLKLNKKSNDILAPMGETASSHKNIFHIFVEAVEVKKVKKRKNSCGM